MNHERTLHERINKIHNNALLDEEGPCGYPADRGLITREVIDHPYKERVLRGYLDYLPTFSGKNAYETIEEKISEKGSISLLDVGCGRGQFLLDLKERWGDAIKPVGITAYPYHKEPSHSNEVVGITREMTSDLLEREGVTVIVGDANNLTKVLKANDIENNFDVIVSVMTYGYLADPLRVVKKIHQSLETGGIAFINDFAYEDTMSNKTYKFLQEFLQNQDFDFNHRQFDSKEFGGFAFKRSSEHLYLPVSYRVKGNELRYIPKKPE